MKKRIAILGSTGSIGRQSLEVIDAHPDIFEVEVLTAYNNVDLLIAQAKKYQPNAVVIVNEAYYKLVSEALKSEPVKVYAGVNALNQVVQMETINLVITAMVGYSGLLPTWHAIHAGKNIALANKETLVVAGELITNLAREKQVDILPVDSEHSAIFQCLIGEIANPVEKIFLTCSGGPFRGKSKQELEHVTIKDALAHPNWEMGEKITIDSATLINKGFEAIEARWLFGLPSSKIDVVIHPQSVIHSMVQFEDGSIKAQMGLPDMRLPIQYALGFPQRIESDFPRFNFIDYPSLTFEKADISVFKNLSMAFDAMKRGGNVSCVLNAANEIAVEAFLNGRCGFVEMSSIIDKTIEKSSFVLKPNLSDYKESDKEAREIATSFLKR